MIETERLILRPWRAEDAAAHHAMCNDPAVMAAFGDAPDLADSHAVVARQGGLLEQYGYCFWAMDLREDRGFAGWCGLKPGKPPIEKETEIGWSIRADLWGRGIAREAAEAVLDWAWTHTDRGEIVAITAAVNARSWGLMERLGMTRYPDEDFDDVSIPAGDPLRRHVLYRIARPA